jgi:hypothetical protein
VPTDGNQGDTPEPSARDSQGGGQGFMGRLKAILGRQDRE